MSNRDPESLRRFWNVVRRVAFATLVVLAGVRAALLDTGFGNVAEFLFGLAVGAVVLLLAVLVCRLVARLLRPLPQAALFTLAAVALALLVLTHYSPAEWLRALVYPDDWSWPLSLPHGYSLPSLFVIVLAIALAAGLLAALKSGALAAFSPRSRSSLLAAVAVLSAVSVTAVVSLISDGSDPYTSEFRLAGAAPARHLATSAGNPALPGSFCVESLSYGAGDNDKRPRFGENRDLESRTVDATALLPEWKGVKKKMRESFWGFGLEEAPLNGLVWAPVGDGPFPLVLIVHGNHGMEDYSDPGYAYLGELLANRGFITVSVDENFINGSWSGDFRGREMPARGWFLLEHLSLWRDWNARADHRFGNRVDMDNIALVGHSRGGEAVPIAYLFNQLSHYPDDATVRFNYGFSIQSLVAIAQVDQRYHRRLDIEDVNFLALQGSYDSDEPAFHGLRQFNRINLAASNSAVPAEPYRFKTGIYIHGANHGQFNSTWGRKDLGPPGSWLLNLEPIIDGEDQRQIASVYISAFLEATLHDDRNYLPLFRDPRSGADWLPEHAYINQFMDSSFVPIATFDEDLDVLTATAEGATVTASDVALWREEELKHRDERPQGTSAVVLGWTEGANPAYRIDLPESFWTGAAAGSDLLTLSVSASTEKLPKDDDGSSDEADEKESDDDDASDVFAPRFTIESRDSSGRVRSVASDDLALLAPPLKVRYLKSERLNKERYKADWEPVLQHLEVPLAEITTLGDDGRFVPVSSLTFRFAGDADGVVILDDIGLRRAVP